MADVIVDVKPAQLHNGPVRNRVTLREVAEMAGVSTRTVSRVVNGETGYGDDTEVRIRAAIGALGYSPNLLARALITRRSGIVGLVCPAISDPFFAELADVLQRRAAESGATLFLASVDYDPEAQASVLAKLHAYGSDGVILFPVEGTDDAIAKFAESGLPIVLVNHDLSLPGVGSLSFDLINGAADAVSHLASRGRKKIAMVANEMSSHSVIPPRREHGYRLGLFRAGLAFETTLMAFSSPTIDGGRECANALLEKAADLDALFAYNDLMAIGALQAFATAGRTVPHDIAVVGFNDIGLCAALVPSLSSMRIDHDELAAQALDLLQRIRNDPVDQQPPLLAPVTLTIRQSSTP